jgi:hypothetical protein
VAEADPIRKRISMGSAHGPAMLSWGKGTPEPDFLLAA